MKDNDIRWKQRLDNYSKALARLSQAVSIVEQKQEWGVEVDDLLKEGLVQRFEYTHELAWNVMKDYEIYQGFVDIRGSRDAFRKALQMGLIHDEEWMRSIEDRNLSSHDYDEATAALIISNILNVYYPLFCEFERTMKAL